MEILPLVFLTSFFVVLLSTPSLIKVALLKRLFDEPDDIRKLHSRRVPTVGGIIIFAGTLFAFSLWFPIDHIHVYEQILASVSDFKYLVATSLILFFVGVKDDIIGTAAFKKLIAHIIVGLVLVLMADIRITGFHGLFGILELPYWASIFLSLFTYIVVVNAFNLIDGVDGLAGGVGFIASLCFGAWFAMAGDYISAALSFALAGSLLGFLIFNFQPAKIFMGDSGSLVVGLFICFMAMKLIEYDKSDIDNFVGGISKPVFVMAILAYPLYDTLRVFIYRAIRGISPFNADRNHIHHRLQDIGLSHKQTVITIYTANIIAVIISVITKDLGPSISFIITASWVLIAAQIPFLIKKKKNRV